MATLKSFLATLAVDPLKLGKLIHSPEKAMEEAKLSWEDQAALRSGLPLVIYARLAGLSLKEAFAISFRSIRKEVSEGPHIPVIEPHKPIILAAALSVGPIRISEVPPATPIRPPFPIYYSRQVPYPVESPFIQWPFQYALYPPMPSYYALPPLMYGSEPQPKIKRAVSKKKNIRKTSRRRTRR